MTLIVGIELPNGGVMMGADSFVGNDGDNCNARIRKIKRRGRIIIGAAGPLACQDFFLDLVEIPPYDDTAPLRWVRKVFGGAVRLGLRESLLSAGDVDGEVLVGVGGKLIAFQGLVGAHEFYDGVATIGSGGAWAQGCLEVTTELKPRTRIRKALEAAAKYSGSINPPWTFATGGR